jgi:hypothetical protein
MKLVDDAKDWSKWWSVRLSIIGGALLTFAEGFPHALQSVISVLPNEVTETIPDGLFKVIGILCVIASPIARVIKQHLPDASNGTDQG